MQKTILWSNNPSCNGEDKMASAKKMKKGIQLEKYTIMVSSVLKCLIGTTTIIQVVEEAQQF